MKHLSQTLLLMLLAVAVPAVAAQPQPAPESVGRIEIRSGAVHVGALSVDGAHPTVAIAITEPGQTIRDTRLAQFSAAEVRRFVNAAYAEIIGYEKDAQSLRAGVARTFPLMDQATSWTGWMNLRYGPAQEPEVGLELSKTSEPFHFGKPLWLSLEEARRVFSLLSTAVDRSVEMTANYSSHKKYRSAPPVH